MSVKLFLLQDVMELHGSLSAPHILLCHYICLSDHDVNPLSSVVSYPPGKMGMDLLFIKMI